MYINEIKLTFYK